MTKDKKNHKNFLIYIHQHTVSSVDKILKQMEEYTEVPWKVNMKQTTEKYLAVETGELDDFFRNKFSDDEKAYVNWRMKWKNQTVEIDT